MLPFEHVWPEAVIGVSFDGVKKGVLGEFEVDEVGFRERPVLRGADFVWMMGCGSGNSRSALVPGLS